MRKKNNFLTVTDIAEIFEISRQAVDSILKEGRLKFFRVGNTRRIKSENLLEYLRNVGNSPGTMKDFEIDIRDYLKQKQEAKNA